LSAAKSGLTSGAVHYLIIPTGWKPPVPARRAMVAGGYSLWTTLTRGYIHIGTVVGLAAGSAYLRVKWGEPDAAETTHLSGPLPTPAGEVISEHDDLANGKVSATVRMRRAGTVILSASFDPGWHVTVDGRGHDAEMIAPALVATKLASGTHTVVFDYQGYGGYPELFLLGALVLSIALLVDVTRSRRSLRASLRRQLRLRR